MRLGLVYPRHMETWLPPVYDLKEYSGTVWAISDEGLPNIVVELRDNLDNYHSLVAGNRGKLIVGIQGCNLKVYDKPAEHTRGIAEMYTAVRRKDRTAFAIVEYSLSGGLQFIDDYHFTDNTGRRIAETYANFVLSQLGER